MGGPGNGLSNGGKAGVAGDDVSAGDERDARGADDAGGGDEDAGGDGGVDCTEGDEVGGNDTGVGSAEGDAVVVGNGNKCGSRESALLYVDVLLESCSSDGAAGEVETESGISIDSSWDNGCCAEVSCGATNSSGT